MSLSCTAKDSRNNTEETKIKIETSSTPEASIYHFSTDTS